VAEPTNCEIRWFPLSSRHPRGAAAVPARCIQVFIAASEVSNAELSEVMIDVPGLQLTPLLAGHRP
jgi:hypothetical protein